METLAATSVVAATRASEALAMVSDQVVPTTAVVQLTAEPLSGDALRPRIEVIDGSATGDGFLGDRYRVNRSADVVPDGSEGDAAGEAAEASAEEEEASVDDATQRPAEEPEQDKKATAPGDDGSPAHPPPPGPPGATLSREDERRREVVAQSTQCEGTSQTQCTRSRNSLEPVARYW